MTLRSQKSVTRYDNVVLTLLDLPHDRLGLHPRRRHDLGVQKTLGAVEVHRELGGGVHLKRSGNKNS